MLQAEYIFDIFDFDGLNKNKEGNKIWSIVRSDFCSKNGSKLIILNSCIEVLI